MKLWQALLAIAAALWWCRHAVHSAKILGLFAHPGEGHFGVMRTLMMELARREHNVTVCSSHRLDERIERLQEVIVEPEFPFWQSLMNETKVPKTSGLVGLAQLPSHTLQKHLARVGAAATDYFLSHPAMQQLLSMPADTFDYDLIIVDLFYSEALLATGAMFNKPIIALLSSNFEQYMEHTVEVMVPAACSPIDYVVNIRQNPTDHAQSVEASGDYWQRLANIRQCMARRKQFVRFNGAAQETVLRQHFPSLAIEDTIPWLYRHVAVLLLNNHAPLLTPRPLMPNIIAAGGMHIRPPRDLPWHVRRFLDESRVGVVYMNLGSEQLCAHIDKAKLELLFHVFSQLKERVLWTCHDADRLGKLPASIMVQHMVPQTDILAHPHVKVFLMNGDLLGLQESIMRHVPILGLPIFRHEHMNMNLAVQLGIGRQLSATNFTAETLKEALEALLNEPSYALAIRRVSYAYRDRPLGALETCMYWIDYVLHHDGGAPVRTPGVGMPSRYLHLVDLFLLYIIAGLVFVGGLVGLYFLAAYIWQRRQKAKVFSKLN